jgi:hypothetical protein
LTLTPAPPGLLKKGSVSAALIEETRWVVPSAIFDYDDPDDFCELADAPGLGETDATKSAHTRRVIRDATAVLVFSCQELEGQSETLNAMIELDLTKEFVFRDYLPCNKSVAIVMNRE